MAENNITFSKIVANPNLEAWAQAYNAGKLFAVISLGKTAQDIEEDYLNRLGKEILDSLEQEFFTLETKDLNSIKQAVNLTSEKIPADISCSFVVAAFIDNVLYLYILGGGKVCLKREGKLGILLESASDSAKDIKDASGFLQDDDLVVLETKQFSDVISTHILSEFLETGNLSDSSEHLAPLIHEKDEAGAAGIIINYKTKRQTEEEMFLSGEKVEEESINENIKEEDEKKVTSPFYSSTIEREQQSGFFGKISSITTGITRFRLSSGGGLSHPRKVILTIVLVILIIFVASVSFAVKKQQDAKTLATFQSIYPEATKKFDEGKSLLGLNEGLAQDSFNEAKKILEEGKNQLPKNSPEEKKVLSLLEEVNNSLTQAPKPNVVSTKNVNSNLSNLLNTEIKNQGLYYSKNTENIYALTSNEIYSFKADGTGKESIITNDSDWSAPGGFANYFGNLYVLDKKSNQILKFVATESDYSKSDYFSDNSNVDFSKAVSMAIDSSVYVLLSSGSVYKYNKGATENFSVSGLDKDLSSPTRIFTNADLDNVYILDNGNSRIVTLDKTGKYKAQYQSDVIKQAKDFDIDEDNSKAYILSGGKVYEIDLK